MRKNIYNTTLLIALAVPLFMIAEHFVLSMISVSGDSMYPYLRQGDLAFISKLPSTYDKGDVVVFLNEENQERTIKRIVGTKDEILYINDYKLFNGSGQIIESQSFWNTDNPLCGSSPVFRVDRDFFLMGDNRCSSRDSRFFGSIHKEEIIGKVILRLKYD